MAKRVSSLIVCAVVLVGLGVLMPMAQRGPTKPAVPGYLGEGVTLLPNGWRIAPAGRHMLIGDLPLAMVQAPDDRHLIVSNNGYAKPTLTVVDLENFDVRAKVPVDHAWLGLAWHPDGRRLYSSGGGQNTVNEFVWADGKLALTASYVLGRTERSGRLGRPEDAGFLGGLAVSPDGGALYAVNVLATSLTAIDLNRQRVRATLDLPAEPYTCLASPDGRALFVSIWGGARVLIFDPATLSQVGEVTVGEHPNAMVLSKDGGRLFVACANTNAVWVIDLATRTAKEQISMALYPGAPVGTTPNALGLSPDGKRLAVANADNNTVALVDVSRPGASEVEGFVPTGWYPTGVMFDRAGKNLFVLAGKGLTSQANPRGPNPGIPEAGGQYTGAMMQGALSVLAVPDEVTLKAMTKRVYDLTAYSDAIKLAPSGAPKASPIPSKVGQASPIKHVFYIIRENRTYDQILGDIERGNGDPTLTLFGEEVTPNAHAIAREFVLLDNFYVDAEVSYDGHAFSTGAYATDFIEKMWPTNYGGRGGVYLGEGGGKMRTPYGSVAAPPEGYLWDFAKRAGVTVRSYGEFADWDKQWGPVTATVPGLEGLVHPSYPPWDLHIPDNRRVDVWLKEFKEFEANGRLPQLSIIRLPNDHTNGTSPDSWTPRSMIAENDLALGRVVEAISSSRYWKESAIFVLEDDAQNGPDHVDSHRSVALVISPFVRHQAVDSTLYSTTAMLRTIELILGLPPMSQFDAAAMPMYNAFQPTPVLAPYTQRPARVPTDERNGADAPGALASLRMNFTEADLTPELELNEIIWKSVRGRDSQMPPPVRTAFVRVVREEKQEEKEK
jgi:YVTN family beta-propeller protein